MEDANIDFGMTKIRDESKVNYPVQSKKTEFKIIT